MVSRKRDFWIGSLDTIDNNANASEADKAQKA